MVGCSDEDGGQRVTVIDNPIINGPYDVPTRHWRFDDQGITDVLLDGRRPSESRVPVPRPRKGKVQLELDLRATSERVQRHDQVDQIRQVVQRWRSRGYPHTTATTKRLLTYWSDPTRDNPILFAQREAAETAIYLAEAAAKDGNGWIATALTEQNAIHNDGLPRMALKMATGSGKTVVMAMLIAWQTLNHVARRWDKNYSRRFLLVAPGITIRDRLRVLVPTDPGSYYAERDLVPADLQGDLRRAELVITNFHSFLLRTTHEARGVAADTRKLVTARLEDDPFVETPPMMVARVLRGLSSTRGHRGGRLVVLNDEAHHCYAPASGEVVTMTPGALGEDEAVAKAPALTGDEKKEASARNADAGVWFSGLRAVAGATDLAAVYDLSATPFFLKGSGYREGLIFPWVVSDFSLVDAIEAGIVKIPRVPVVDDAEGDAVTYLNLWHAVDQDLKPSRAKAAVAAGMPLPTTLAGAMESLYSSYSRAFDRWEISRQDDSHRAGATPPVFIVVCPNTAVSRWVYEAIAGRSVTVEDPDAAGGVRTLHAPGALPLLSNVVDGAPLSRPRSILVDSAQLESEDALTKDFRAVAADEIAAFRGEYAERTGRDADDLSDGDLLREVLNTVGKPGRLGEDVRCVVSVSMLSEGWDANTVTHVLGVRAFGSQLLCEQVVGRGLRRRSYVANEQGFFEPEYAEVYGVPFSVIPTDRPVVDPPVKPPPVRVRALVERREARITFPRLDGYRIEVPDRHLYTDFTDVAPYVVRTRAIPTTTETAGLIGTSEVQDLGRFRGAREASIAFTLAKQLMPTFAGEVGDRRWLFPQLVSIAQRWLAEHVVYEKGTFPGMLLVGTTLADAANRLRDAIVQQRDGREPLVLPVFAGDTVTGRTDAVSFSTTKRVIETRADKCHVDGVVLDGRDGNTWEQIAAMACEASDDVAAYVKNDHLELAIPYTMAGRAHRYLPDFVVRLTPGEDGVTRHLLLEVSGGIGREAKDVKIAAARIMWCAAVNNDGRFGRWGFVEVDDPVRTVSDLAHAIAALRADAPITGLPSVLEGVLAETTDDDEELFRAPADAP